jgi:LysM repeat protein
VDVADASPGTSETPVRTARLDERASEAPERAPSEPTERTTTERTTTDQRSEAEQTSEAAPPQTYRVRSGDTLSRISRRFGIPVRDLRRWNHLASTRITVGQTLRLTPQDVASSSTRDGSVTYRVRSGDTLERIAQLFAVSVRELQQWNGLSGSRIYPGQRLDIRNGSTADVHVVQSGDTLGSIAQSYGTTVQRLRALNSLRGSRIYPGQKLRVASE